MRSESQPEPRRSSEAVLSATPSINPRLATEALSVEVTNSGSTGMIISVDTSVNSDVKPSATMLRLMPLDPAGAAGGAAGVVVVTAPQPSTGPGRGLPGPWRRARYSRCEPFAFRTALVQIASERRIAATRLGSGAPRLYL